MRTKLICFALFVIISLSCKAQYDYGLLDSARLCLQKGDCGMANKHYHAYQTLTKKSDLEFEAKLKECGTPTPSKPNVPAKEPVKDNKMVLRLKDQLRETKDSLDIERAAVKTLRTKVNRLSTEINTLRGQLASSEDSLSIAMRKAISMAEELKDKAEEVRRLESVLRTKEDSIEEKDQVIGAQESRIKEQSNVIEVLENQIKEQLKVIKALEDAISSKKNE